MKIIADVNIPFVKDCFCSIGDVETVAGGEIDADVVADADALLVRSVTKVNAGLLAGSSVRFVATATIGFDHIDRDFLANNDIGFASAPGSNAISVAEYVVAAMLCVGQKKEIELEGSSIGIIGVGNVGSRAAKRCEALGMKVVLNDPPLQRASGDEKYRPIEELYDCDFITMHTPLTREGQDKTFHLADEKFFKSLKSGCVFLNTSRGPVAKTAAVKDAIRSGRLKVAVLDVWENEPEIAAELLEMVDVGTPHIAGYSFDGKVAGMVMIYEAVCDYFGLEAKYDAKAFLPEPAVKQIEVNSKLVSAQDVLTEVVGRLYDIKADDARLREILNLPGPERGVYFRQLRKNYPVRREFGNTELILDSDCDYLAKKLAGIGFKIKS